jgi:leucine dehydrogenase
MRLFERIQNEGYEQIVYCHDKDVGLKAIISIHDSTLGPAVGGCRMYPYATEDQALEDVLRLSKGMTYKSSISGLNWGGGKAVIIGDPKKDITPRLLKRYAQFVNTLGGRYVTAKDVGISTADLRVMLGESKHVMGLDDVPGSSGDPSIYTGWGVYNGMKAAAAHTWGSDSLKGKRIAIQGLGKVAYYLIEHLAKEGADIVGADVDTDAINRARKDFGVKIVDADKILFEDCDILSPNAMGGSITKDVAAKIKCKIVAGGANNQLATPEEGYTLMQRGIVYAPDYAINAGGIMNIYNEIGGYDAKRAWDHVAHIRGTVGRILERAKTEKLPPHLIADRMAEERIAHAKQRR